MFNGLIRDFGTVRSASAGRLEIASPLCEQISAQIGDSIAINGACLSVTAMSAGSFCVALSDETAAVIAPFVPGARVHLEPAMQLGARIDGHLLQGHIDALGRVQAVKDLSVGRDVFIELPAAAARYVAPKGSIAINGVSLTVNDISGRLLRLTLIPITLEKTLLGQLRAGDLVNVETDLLARYAERILRYESGLAGGSAGEVSHAALY